MARIRPVWASAAAATRSAPPPLHHMRLAVRLVRNPPEAVPRLRDGQAQAEAAPIPAEIAQIRAPFSSTGCGSTTAHLMPRPSSRRPLADRLFLQPPPLLDDGVDVEGEAVGVTCRDLHDPHLPQQGGDEPRRALAALVTVAKPAAGRRRVRQTRRRGHRLRATAQAVAAARNCRA